MGWKTVQYLILYFRYSYARFLNYVFHSHRCIGAFWGAYLAHCVNISQIVIPKWEQIIQNRGILLAKRQLHGFMLLPVMDTDQGDLLLERLTSVLQITAAASSPNISRMSLNASTR